MRFNAILIKIPNQFFIELEKAILKFNWNNKKPRTAKIILNSRRTSGGISILDLNQALLQSNIVKNFMVLVQWQAGRSKE